MLRVLLINNDGGGFADRVEVEPGTTVSDLFDGHIGGDADNYFIRVNREIASPDQVLAEGDKVTFTPKKIDGA